MKPLDKKDMPKLYALGGLAACIFGYAVYQFAAGGGSTATAAAGVATPGAKASPAPGAAAGPIAAGATPGTPETPGGAAGTVSPTPGVKPGGITGTMVSGPGGIAPFDTALVGPPSGGKDPFMPVGKAAQTKTGFSTPAPAATTSVPAFTPIAAAPRKTGLDKLLDYAQQKLSTGTVNPSAAQNVGSPTGGPVVLPPAPPPDMVVTGVVLGDVSNGAARNVAIMRGKGGDGKDERRFVSVGDPLGNGFTVTAVHADGVDIKDKTRNITLKLGSAGDNARAK